MLVNGHADPALYRPDHWDDAVLLHEYGHHVARQLNFDNSPGGLHSLISASVASSGPNQQLAWSEGFATYFACQAQAGAPVDWKDSGSNNQVIQTRIVDLERGVYTDPSVPQGVNVNDQGATWEVPVAASLWDLYDVPSDNPNNDFYRDRIADGIDESWDVMTNHVDSVNTVPRFHTLYRTRYDTTVARSADLNETFCEHGMCPVLVGVDEDAGTVEFGLRAIVPNPSTPGGGRILEFLVPNAVGTVEVEVISVSGRSVRKLKSSVGAGRSACFWDGRDSAGRVVPAGLYFVRGRAGTTETTGKLVIVP
jgi:hypothetical protein